jgi:hypothetical protein
LGDFGRIWENLGEFGRIWENLGEFGRIWENSGKCGRFGVKSYEFSQILIQELGENLRNSG